MHTLYFTIALSETFSTCVCSPQIYLINLRRRQDRRDRMLWSLYELEIDAKVVDAVDGA